MLFDEIGAGTDPAEGAALAKSILATLKEKGAYILASTHYGELKAFAYNTPGFRNASLEFDVKSLRPTYKVLMGSPGASHALRIAERYGLPKEVIERAYEGLLWKQQISKMMEELELAQRRARVAQSEADKRSAEIRKVEERAAAKLLEAEEIRTNVHAKAAETIEAALREIRTEAAAIFEELRNNSAGGANAQAREKLKELQSFGQSVAGEFQAKQAKTTKQPESIKRGMQVKVEGYPQAGTVLEDPQNGTVMVQLGALRLCADLGQVSKTQRRLNRSLNLSQTLVWSVRKTPPQKFT